MTVRAGSPEHRAALGVLACLAAAALWSLNGPLIKLLSRDGDGVTGLPGITIACYRSLIGGAIFLIPGLMHVRSLAAAGPAWPIASVITFSLMTACFVIATTRTAASSAIALQYVAPIVVFLASPWLLRETPRWREGAALALSMVGVAVIFAGAGRADLPTLFIALGSGIGYGILMITLRGLRNVHPTTVVAMNFVGSGLLMLGPMLVTGHASMTPGQWALVSLMSVIQFALPYLLFSWGLQYVPAHRASLIALLELVLNPILTWLAVGETIPPATLAGGGLILLGVALWLCLDARTRADRPRSERRA